MYAINRQTKGRNYTNFKSDLAMTVMYLPVKIALDWTKRFQGNVDGQMDGITSISKGT